MREVELKSVVEDVAAARAAVEKAGAILTYEGALLDFRYGDREGRLLAGDLVVRLRVYESGGEREGFLDWKGPTMYEDGYKVREELSTSVGDPGTMERILENLGLQVIRRIDRQIAQYRLAGAVIRFEHYPRMDDLVEVEGSPADIEQAILATGLPRDGFNTDRLPDFVARFEARTGQTAAVAATD